MTTLDFTPLYRSTVGFDRLAHLMTNANQQKGSNNTGYPPYNIERVDENKYQITIAVAGFAEEELDLQVENGVLTVSGSKDKDDVSREYLYQGIATRAFERKFNLADHIEVVDADIKNGLLYVNLLKEVPEAMKPRSIAINSAKTTIEQA